MVVNGYTYMPGAGCFKFYTQLTGNKVYENSKFFEEELEKVINYKNTNSNGTKPMIY